MPSTAAQFSILKWKYKIRNRVYAQVVPFLFFNQQIKKKETNFCKKGFEVLHSFPCGTDPDIGFRIGANYINHIVSQSSVLFLLKRHTSLKPSTAQPRHQAECLARHPQ